MASRRDSLLLLRRHSATREKVNFHKEFFRVGLDAIQQAVEKQPGEVIRFVAEPIAEQYRNSLSVNDADYEFLGHTIEAATEGKDNDFEDS
jgi:hypothetical protein